MLGHSSTNEMNLRKVATNAVSKRDDLRFRRIKRDNKAIWDIVFEKFERVFVEAFF